MDLEAFLQEMPDYLVAEMDRYAVCVAPYYYAKLDIAWPDSSATTTMSTLRHMREASGGECDFEKPNLADFFRLGFDDAANWKLDRQYLEPFPFLINEEVARILTTKACARSAGSSQGYRIDSTAAAATAWLGQLRTYGWCAAPRGGCVWF